MTTTPFEAAMQAAAAQPGAALSEPFGPGVFVWKVGGKIFAAISDVGVCVKCPDIEAAAHLIALGLASRAPYFHPSWAMVRFDTAPETVGPRIDASYAVIRAALPRRLREGLG